MTQSSQSPQSQPQSPSPSKPQSPRTLTPRERDARRASAQKSTGPRTARGRRFSRRNAMQHGHYAAHYSEAFRETILALKEDPEAFDRLLERLRGSLATGDDSPDAFQPLGPVLALASEELAQLHWELDRERRRQNRMRDARLHALDRELVHRRAELETDEYQFPGFEPGGLERTVRDAPSANRYKAILDHLAQLIDQVDHQDFKNYERSVDLLYAVYGEMSRVGQSILVDFRRLSGNYEGIVPDPDSHTAAELRARLVEEREKYAKEYEAFKPYWPVIPEADRERARDLESLLTAEDDDPERIAWEASVKRQEYLRRAIDRKLRTILALQRESRLQEAHAARMADRNGGDGGAAGEDRHATVGRARGTSRKSRVETRTTEGASRGLKSASTPSADFLPSPPGGREPALSGAKEAGGEGDTSGGQDARAPQDASSKNEGTNRGSGLKSTERRDSWRAPGAVKADQVRSARLDGGNTHLVLT